MKHYPLKADGSFRICQLTDIHLHTYDRFEEGEQTYALLRQILRDTKPDLVVVTGDIAWGAAPEKAIAELETIFSEANVMWAPVLGNHDGEYFMETQNIPNEEGRRIFADLLFTPNSLFERGEAGVDGNGNYVITVGGTEDEPEWALFLLDSHRGYFDLSQNLWYRRTSQAMPHKNELS
ncbi:MAG: metallophosphoesterase, partial [Clostridia bacterium]|nr:metallophosphoesterase [Clostridia bacterium]